MSTDQTEENSMKTSTKDKIKPDQTKQLAETELVQKFKQSYLRNPQYGSILNECDKFRINDKHINLTIITINENQAKQTTVTGEYKTSDENLGSYPIIHETKKLKHIEEIFNQSDGIIKRYLILGKAGIGKSTFCKYLMYRWAEGSSLSDYQLVVMIRLRELTKDFFLAGKNRPSDLILQQFSREQTFSDEERKTLENICDRKKILWLLDGYDELVENIPSGSNNTFANILKNENHILTSWSYPIDRPYSHKLKIIGFLDDDTTKYV